MFVLMTVMTGALEREKKKKDLLPKTTNIGEQNNINENNTVI